MFYKKTEKWSYEKELRLLKEKTGKIKFKPSCLQNVLIGCDAEQDFINTVVDIVKDNHNKVNIFQVIEPVSTGKLSYKPVYIPK